MGYNKFIKSGSTFELYEYEKDIRISAPRARKVVNARKPCNLDLDIGGADPFSQGYVGKRQDNARRASMAFRRLILCNLTGFNFPLLVTITYAENQEDIRIGYKDFKTFIQSLRYKFGKVFRYVAVPEFQKRGAVHFHALFWGLPEGIFDTERKTRQLAILWGKGFIYLKKTDGDDRLSSYLAKYMVKAFLDFRLKGQRAYTSSRNCLRPEIVAGFSPVWPVVDDLVGVDNSPLLEKEYMTQWLGKGRYRLFKV